MCCPSVQLVIYVGVSRIKYSRNTENRSRCEACAFLAITVICMEEMKDVLEYQSNTSKM